MRILIGLDGSPQADTGLDFVRRLELTPSDEVIVVAVAEMPTTVGALTDPPAALAWYEELRQAAVEGSRTIVDAATASLGGPGRITPLVEEGHPLERLERVARERDVDLVVVGPHGRGRFEALIVGSVSQGLLQSLPASVLVAREVRNELRTVVLAVDGSAHGRSAARLLAALPLPAGANVLCLSIVPPTDGAYGRAWSDELMPVVEARQNEAADRALDEAEAELGAGRFEVTREIGRGSPKQAILEAADGRGADLIVLGARGLGGFEALVIGSVSRAVSKAAACSVLVARRGTES